MPEGYSPGPKWWPLQRGFRAFQLLFPGSGGFVGPSQVRDDVQLVEGLYRASIAHDVRFSSDVQGPIATGGVTTSITHPEPASGYFHIPCVWNTTYDGAANIGVDGVLVATAGGPDPWGRFAASNVTLSQVRGGSSRHANMPVFPYMRGHQLRATFNGPAGATNVYSALVYLELPGELCTLELWRALYGNYVNNSPIP